MRAPSPALFDLGSAPRFDAAFRGLRHYPLGEGAWIDHVPGWVDGHTALFTELEAGLAWRHEQRPMYERIVDVPRRVARVPEDGPTPPFLARVADVLGVRYSFTFDRIHLALYRTGQDSVAWHSDKVNVDTIVAIVSVGTPRKFLFRPLAGGTSRAFALGWGDLFVMGGTFQSHYQHAVPKTRFAEPRMSIVFGCRAHNRSWDDAQAST